MIYLLRGAQRFDGVVYSEMQPVVDVIDKVHLLHHIVERDQPCQEDDLLYSVSHIINDD